MRKSIINQKLSAIGSIQLLLVLLFTVSQVSCKDDNDVEPVLPEPEQQ